MKRMSWMLGAVVVGVAALTGCSSENKSDSSSAEKLTVQGSVSARLGTDNARAVAIGADGKKVWTYLDRNGDFTLRLAAGKSYRVLIANQLPGGGQKVIGKVSVKNGATKTSWITAKSSANIDLGTLSKPETTLDQGVAPKCGCDFDNSSAKGSPKGDEDSSDSPSEKTDKGGYGGSSSKGEGKGDWGGGGWDEGDDDDDAVDNKKGPDMGDKGSDHDDDNDCFGDDDDVFGDKEGWSKDGKDGKDMDDADLCDVCTDGGFVDLEPSKKDAGNFGDFDKKADANVPESKACSKKTDAKPTDKPPTDPKKVDTTDKGPPANGSDKGTPDPGNAKEDESGSETKATVDPSIVQSKKLGDKCSVKTQCGANSCIAGKCISK